MPGEVEPQRFLRNPPASPRWVRGLCPRPAGKGSSSTPLCRGDVCIITNVASK